MLIYTRAAIKLRHDHILTRNKLLRSLFGTRQRPPPLVGHGTVVLVHVTVMTVFTPADANSSSGANKPESVLTKINSADVKTPLVFFFHFLSLFFFSLFLKKALYLFPLLIGFLSLLFIFDSLLHLMMSFMQPLL